MEKNIIELKEELENVKKENANHLLKLQEARNFIEAIKAGHVDALVVKEGKSRKIYTESSADKIYRLLMEKMHEGAVTLNEDGIILFSNSCFSEMVNAPLKKIIGNDFINYIEAPSKSRFENLLNDSKMNPAKDEYYIGARGQKSIPVLISINTLSLESKSVFNLIITDISNIKKHQEELITQKKLLEEAEKIAEMGSWTVNLKTKEITVSPEFYKIYGLTDKSSLTLTPYDLIHQNDRAASKEIFDTAVKETGSFDFFTSINTPAEIEKKILHVKGKVILKKGKAYQFIGTSQNVTAILKAEREHYDQNKKLLKAQQEITNLNQELEFKVIERTKVLESAYDRLEEINYELDKATKSKDKFISIISHDLRNPFTSIIATSEILMTDIKSLKQEEIEILAKIINGSSVKIVNQLNELVELSKQKSKKINFDPQNRNLYELVSLSTELIEENAKQKEIQIINEVDKSFRVRVDPFLIRSIFQNLITNSIKFTPKGGRIIASALKKGNSFIQISIKDTGIGMSDQNREKLFSYESAINSSEPEKDESRGLGLILVKDFIKKHKGKIWVESEVGKGTTFHFTLPIGK
ncbi:MAG: PAS domain-containing sensor histidine kinase [Bacteroidota bacterium]|nr:PAS domain-containing sensor histidine kinase [Bacteroidota bacterium]